MHSSTEKTTGRLETVLDPAIPRSDLVPGQLSGLGGPGMAWGILEGEVDLFAILRLKGRQTGPREHICALPRDSLIWGIDQSETEDGIHLTVLPQTTTRIAHLPLDTIQTLARYPASQAVIVDATNAWIEGLANGVTKHLDWRRHREFTVDVGKEIAVDDETCVDAGKGVVWTQIAQGIGRFVDVTPITSPDGTAMIPLTPRTWLEGRETCRVIGHDTVSVLTDASLSRRMALVHAWTFHALAYNLRNVISQDLGWLDKRDAEVQGTTARTLGTLSALLSNRDPKVPVAQADDALFECCRLVGQAIGTPMVMPSWAKRRRAQDPPISVQDIANASKVRVREVGLQKAWWRQDNGPVLAQIKDEDENGNPVLRPAALIPRRGNRYVLHDPIFRREVPVTHTEAKTLANQAWCLYAGLPARPVSLIDLLRFGLRTSRGDLLVLVLAGMIGGLLTMTIPIATGYLFDHVIPGHQGTQLLQVGIAMLAVSLGAITFRLAADIAQLRIEGRVAGTLQAAVMDRLLRMPNTFFSAYSTGDLALRGMAIETIRGRLSGAVIGSLVAGVFSLVNLALLFFYSTAAGLTALGVLACLGLGVTWIGGHLMRTSLHAANMTGKINSLILALVSGITKLRLAGAEDRAFNLWGIRFREMRESQVRAFRLYNTFSVYWAGLETMGLALLFGGVVYGADASLSTGEFLAVIAAFTGLTLAVGGGARALLAVLSVTPAYQRAVPILKTPPEGDVEKSDPGKLRGGFDVSTVRFRYTTETPLILDQVSITARPGEFIAVVGPSGSGKSTLIRLLLGFETPQTGAVFFDGQDLRGLDLQRVRSQIGVVLQDGRLMPGTILENIKGASNANVNDCWTAAERAGIDEEIKAMPMGMHTVLTEGASTLSGGQIQRILVARAIVARPRLLLLDEATSALDNKVQAAVTKSLNTLRVTRLVVAHRLSTIKEADRIYVLDRGQIVETGTYQELDDRKGVFADLVRRQKT